MHLIKYSEQAAKDAKKIRSAGLEEKTRRLIDIVRTNPFAKPPSFEALVGNLGGLYSRRISLQYRLVYRVISGPIDQDDASYDGIAKIVRMWIRYESVQREQGSKKLSRPMNTRARPSKRKVAYEQVRNAPLRYRSTPYSSL